MCYNCIDRHSQVSPESPVLIWESNMVNKSKVISYAELKCLCARLATILMKFGVRPGERVVIFCPMIPEAIISVFACSRIAAIHSIVFGGFASKELARRIFDCKPKLIICASCGFEPSKVIDYKKLVDGAIKELGEAGKSIKVIVIQREEHPTGDWVVGRDFDFWSLLEIEKEEQECQIVKSTHPLYILYTSGTTGEPKGVVRDTGGTAVALNWTMNHIMGLKKGDVYFSTSDIGWVVGHSFIIYGPLLMGAATVIYEGKPNTPDPSAWWKIIEKYKAVGLYTAPTAIRTLRKEDPQGSYIKKHNISSLKTISFAGERCDISTYQWIQNQLKGVLCNDHYWQTETGWMISCNYANLFTFPSKAGSATKPCPGFNLKIVNNFGEVLGLNQLGRILIKLPMPPSFMQTLWGNDEGFVAKYITYDGYYKTGDAGYFDEDGYLHVMTRLDDVINTCGHRLSTAQMEEVLLQHKAVNESAVVSVKDKMKGEVPVGFICLKNDFSSEDHQTIIKELVNLVRIEIGPVAVFKSVLIVPKLPKTRSGKIIRYTLKLSLIHI
eukprot:TRINITY_DN1085_c0_g1_i1.p1 TRINITY_DN1085_c0_g1~~TRINITY_DN1085_c0_g1_i1.p1  ORF type:complete len:553 (-),score=63.70 TRINITY_DN1085_c0_g1_i1:119-1777(-)